MDTSSYEASLKDINYNWRELGSEKEMLQNEMYREYAYLQLLKMCHFLKKVRNIEILKMQAQFLKDDNHNVWFSYAHSINYRGRDKRDQDFDPEDTISPQQIADNIRNQK